ncbi:MAG: hypothetical protein D6740_12880, partial [Alphaproteobacteria bacterium]
PVEAAPMKPARALALISKRLGRPLTADEHAAITNRYPHGMTEADIDAWMHQASTKERLRAV